MSDSCRCRLSLLGLIDGGFLTNGTAARTSTILSMIADRRYVPYKSSDRITDGSSNLAFRIQFHVPDGVLQ